MTPEQRINLSKMAEASTFEGAEYSVNCVTTWNPFNMDYPQFSARPECYRVRVPRPEVVKPYEDASELDGAVLAWRENAGDCFIAKRFKRDTIEIVQGDCNCYSLKYLAANALQYQGPHDWRACGVITPGGYTYYSINGQTTEE